MSPWLSFARIKHHVTMQLLLERIGWKPVSRRGNRVHGPCPIHRGQRADTFHADLAKNIFHCFSCHAHGDVIDLVAALENSSIRQAALSLQRWLVPAGDDYTGNPEPFVNQTSQPVRKKITGAPLRFSLHPVDTSHPYLQQRGITPSTAGHFGVGYYGGPGLMRGRVVIPLHDEQGQLIAYAGRSIDQSPPKYRIPAGFAKSEVLFNFHRAKTLAGSRVIVVEGFFGCMMIHQAGFPSVVALMGCTLSLHQHNLLCERFPMITLMLDPDDAGRRASDFISRQLARHCRVQIVRPPDHPDEMSLTLIQSLLELKHSTSPRL
jgi:DNA primase